MSEVLFVANIPWATTEEELKEYLETAVPVRAVKIIKDRQTGESRGFGFANMNNKEDAKACREKLDNTLFNGRKLRVDYAKSEPRGY